MFTWNPIHKEAAQRLLKFRTRQDELSKIAARMELTALKVISRVGHAPEEVTFPLAEINPFAILTCGKTEALTASFSETSRIFTFPHRLPLI